MKNFAFAIAAAGLAITGAQVSAGEKGVAVTYADLDLTSAEGQKTLERRLSSAIEQVCQTDAIRTGTRIKSSASKQCAKQAEAQAKQQVAVIVEREKLGG